MRNFTLFFILLLLSKTAISQQKKLDIDWVKQFYSSTYKGNSNIAADKHDNLYAIINYDTLRYGSLNLSSANHASAVVLKLNSEGEMIWNYPLHDNATKVELFSITVNENGNTFIYGNYTGELKLSTEITLEKTPNDFSKNTFLAKLDSSGQLKWAQLLENGPITSYLVPLANDGILLKNESSLGYAQLGDSTFFNESSYGMASYDSSGNFKSIYIQSNTANVIENWHATSDREGNIFTLITLKSGSIKIGDNTYTNQSSAKKSYLLTKLNSKMEVLWVKHWQSAISNNITSVGGNFALSSDVDGNLYIANIFSDTFNIENKTVISTKGAKLFVAKLDKNGEVQWLKQGNSASGIESGRMLGIRGNKVVLIANGTNLIFDNIKNINGPAVLSLDKNTGQPLSANTWILENGGFYVLGEDAHFAITSLFPGKELYIKDKPYNSVGKADLLLIKLDTVLVNSVFENHFNNINTIVYPNPATENINIRILNAFPLTPIKLSITDLTGKIVYQQNLLSSSGTIQNSINVASLPSGMYFINIFTPKGQSTQKLIVNK